MLKSKLPNLVDPLVWSVHDFFGGTNYIWVTCPGVSVPYLHTRCPGGVPGDTTVRAYVHVDLQECLCEITSTSGPNTQKDKEKKEKQ